MDSYQAKIGWKRMSKSENKNYRSVPSRREIEIFKRIAEKFRKLKTTIMASFQFKIGWKRLKKQKITIIVPFRSYSTLNSKLKKNSKKIPKTKKHCYGFISSQNRSENDEIERK